METDERNPIARVVVARGRAPRGGTLGEIVVRRIASLQIILQKRSNLKEDPNLRRKSMIQRSWYIKA